jgi:hypothetical protein
VTFRRVIDNDNFVWAYPKTVLTSGLYLLHQVGGPHECGRAGRSVSKGIDDETAGRIVGTMRRRSKTVPAASRQRIAVFCPIELNVKHGLTSIWAARLSDQSDLSIGFTAVFRALRTSSLASAAGEKIRRSRRVLPSRKVTLLAPCCINIMRSCAGDLTGYSLEKKKKKNVKQSFLINWKSYENSGS